MCVCVLMIKYEYCTMYMRFLYFRAQKFRFVSSFDIKYFFVVISCNHHRCNHSLSSSRTRKYSWPRHWQLQFIHKTRLENLFGFCAYNMHTNASEYHLSFFFFIFLFIFHIFYSFSLPLRFSSLFSSVCAFV